MEEDREFIIKYIVIDLKQLWRLNSLLATSPGTDRSDRTRKRPASVGKKTPRVALPTRGWSAGGPSRWQSQRVKFTRHSHTFLELGVKAARW